MCGLITKLHSTFRCLDSSAGYLYHDPDICSRIATACACLHNICIEKGIEMEHDNNEDPDNYNPIQPQLEQPAQYLQPQEHIAARKNFIDQYFTPAAVFGRAQVVNEFV